MIRNILLSGILTLSITVYAQTFTEGDFSYSITSTSPATVEVGPSLDATGDIVIPDSVFNDGVFYSVTSIGDSAFYSNGLTSVVIPDDVINIGAVAFQSNSLCEP